jgi:hypothetical protein
MANEQEENARRTMKENRAASEHNYDVGRVRGKPTPTQEENDLHMLGVHLERHEDDGSGEEPPFGVLRREARPERTGAPAHTPAPAARPARQTQG